MFLKSTKQKNGRINLSIVHGYRDPVTKKTKHKVIENFGYVDEYWIATRSYSTFYLICYLI